MPASFFHAGRFRLLPIAGCLCVLTLAIAAPQHGAGSYSPYEKAQRMREALEGKPERQRTRADYERVMSAYRSIYHSDPASPRADASASSVADLLAEQGRIFDDDKTLYDAIGQYEFLRRQYPGSRYRFSALLTEGEIYLRDLNERESARTTFEEFLRLYPQNPLANEARIELANLKTPAKNAHAATLTPSNPADAGSSHSTSGRRTVLAAAINSQQQNVSGPAKSTPSHEPAPIQGQQQAFAESDIAPAPQRQPVAEPARVTDAKLSTAPPPRQGRLPLVTGIRHWSTPIYTRVAIDLQDEVQYEAVRVPNPDRIFFDLHGARLSPELIGKSDEVIDDGFLKRVRAAQFSNDITRIVLDVSDVSEYSAFFLPNPSRLIIDVHGRKSRSGPIYTAAAPTAATPAPPTPVAPKPVTQPAPKIVAAATVVSSKPTIGIGPETRDVDTLGQPLPSAKKVNVAQRSSPKAQPSDASALADVATLSQQPNNVKATKRPTKAPVVQSVAGRLRRRSRMKWRRRRRLRFPHRSRIPHAVAGQAQPPAQPHSRFMSPNRPPMGSARWCGRWG